MIPPRSAQIRICEVTTLVSTSPAATVLATAVPDRAPIRFVLAAKTMAMRGVKALVETTAAMQFAVSCSPLMYSKTSATKMTVKINVMHLGILQNDMIDDVARVATAID